MSFWDSSAIVPLCVNESRSQAARRLWRLFDVHSVWSDAVVEVESALARLENEGSLNPEAYKFASKQLAALELRWSPIESSSRVIELARTFPRMYGLRALDSLQLVASLVSCREVPKNIDFVSADIRLLKAAEAIGFTIHYLN